MGTPTGGSSPRTSLAPSPRRGRPEGRRDSVAEDGQRDEVKVAVRLRPALDQTRALAYQADEADQTKLLGTASESCLATSSCYGMAGSPALQVEELQFSRVVGPNEDNQQAFAALGMHELIAGVTRGFHETVFAYGQTGSGKTHTILGSGDGEPGLLQLCAQQLFHMVLGSGAESEAQGARRIITLSCLEIRNEDVFDLSLEAQQNGEGSPGATEGHAMQETETIIVRGRRHTFRRVAIWSYEEASQLLQNAVASRKVGSSCVNSESSRSHMVVRFNVRTFSAGSNTGVAGCLTLVDLAGNERECLADGNATRKEETKAINVSLTHLNRMLVKMQNGQLDESDRRQSALNMVLYESLREDCGVTMVFCIHPEIRFAASARSTLQMALRCRKIVRRKRVRRLDTSCNHEELAGLRVEAFARTQAHQQALAANMVKETELRQTTELLHFMKKQLEEKSKDLEVLRHTFDFEIQHLGERMAEGEREKIELERKTVELERKNKQLESALLMRKVEDLQKPQQFFIGEDREGQAWQKGKEVDEQAEGSRRTHVAAWASPPNSSSGEPCSEPSMHSTLASQGMADEADADTAVPSEATQATTQWRQSLPHVVCTMQVAGFAREAREAIATVPSPQRKKVLAPSSPNVWHTIRPASPPRFVTRETVYVMPPTYRVAPALSTPPRPTSQVSPPRASSKDRPPLPAGLQVSLKVSPQVSPVRNLANQSFACHVKAVSESSKAVSVDVAREDEAAQTKSVTRAASAGVVGNGSSSSSRSKASASSKVEQALNLLAEAPGTHDVPVLEAALAQLHRAVCRGRVENAHRSECAWTAMRCMRIMPRSMAVQRDGAMLLAEVALEDPSLKSELVDRGALPMSVAALTWIAGLCSQDLGRSSSVFQEEVTPELIREACAACFRLLAVICKGDKTRQDKARELGGLSAALRCLDSPLLTEGSAKHVLEVMTTGCWLLMSLCSKHPVNQGCILAAGGVSLLLQCLDSHLTQLEVGASTGIEITLQATRVVEPESALLCTYVTGCLACLVECSPAAQQALHQYGAVGVLLRTLDMCLQSAHVVANVCVALGHLAHRHEPSQREARIQGGIVAILGALLAYRGHSAIQGSICRAIAELSEGNAQNQQAFLLARLPDGTSETGSVALLFQALRGAKVAEDAALVTTACWALANLVVNCPEAMDHARMLQGPQVLVSLLDGPLAWEEGACQFLCKLLAELTRGNCFAAKKNRSELKILQAAEVVRRAAQIYADSPSFALTSARDALSNLQA